MSHYFKLSIFIFLIFPYCTLFQAYCRINTKSALYAKPSYYSYKIAQKRTLASYNIFT